MWSTPCPASAADAERVVAAAVAAERMRIGSPPTEFRPGGGRPGFSRGADETARTMSMEEAGFARGARGQAHPGAHPDVGEEGRADGRGRHPDAAAGAGDKLGFTLRQPRGGPAITPFNYPRCSWPTRRGQRRHAVILKPAGQTPLTALQFTEILLDAGLPEDALQCLTGPGRELGPALRRPPCGRSPSRARPRWARMRGSA